MTRILVHVEGETEETFVNEVLRDHLIRIVRGYDKPFMGNLAMLEIGLDQIRRECRHFDGWLKRLELLPETGKPDA